MHMKYKIALDIATTETSTQKQQSTSKYKVYITGSHAVRV